MFKFDFGVEDEEGEVTVQNIATQDVVPASETSATAAARYRTIHLEEFVIDELDDEDENVEAKVEYTQDDQNTAEYVNADTDLIPGTYEGGLKTWEGGMDLVEVLEEQHKKIPRGIGSWVKGKKVLEVGCGTGLPCAYLLRRLLELPADSSVVTELHLQDYNISVLQLVTLPNLILASMSEETLAEMDSNLELSDEVIQEFREQLKLHNIQLRFSCGDWSGFAQALRPSEGETEAPYDLVLTAETIYRLESVPSLLKVLKYASRRDDREASPTREGSDTVDVASALDGLTLQKPWGADETVILVAAKVSPEKSIQLLHYGGILIAASARYSILVLEVVCRISPIASNEPMAR
ncbi:hypothetical protein QFC21_000919 [Naganishia friedmannii]|uniref:Uncharacterized protein n=1 Tax=Naganishia friedmannii TaxID=89922 RepID=A0ACC2W7R6_9TREE|nr:hypothetical protein QFC21_000919 [Naganishia friedmannii]